VSGFSRPLLVLILGQISLHSSMAGMRVATPLQALGQGHSAWRVGLLLALFAVAPVVLALPAGRLADRFGYHRPLWVAVGLSLAGGVVAAASSHYLAMCVAAMLSGCGANFGLIAIQRTAGRMATDATQRMRVFSWLGLAPALSNLVGPVTAGVLIDLAGFRTAFGVLMLLPLAALFWARLVPVEAVAPVRPGASAFSGAWALLRLPPVRHLLLLNWLLSASWDVHAFVLPILGHQRGLSASAIGGILGIFALAVAGVRVLIPLLAHRVTASRVLQAAMLSTAAVFTAYPFLHSAWAMAACAALLGLSLGATQPMIMTTLHQVTPADRHGQAIALRSMTLNLSSSVMPLLFGVLGAAMGVGTLFWLMGAAVGLGCAQAHRVGLEREGP
jgi:MFS family permease